MTACRNSGTATIVEDMETTRLGKKGQISIPRAVIDRLGLEPDTLLLVEASSDGAITLRPAAVYPLELYGDDEVRELLEEDRLTDEEANRLRKALHQE